MRRETGHTQITHNKNNITQHTTHTQTQNEQRRSDRLIVEVAVVAPRVDPRKKLEVKGALQLLMNRYG